MMFDGAILQVQVHIRLDRLTEVPSTIRNFNDDIWVTGAKLEASR